MTEALGIAKAIVPPAVRYFLADRKRVTERSLPLAELINVKITDDWKRRKLNREIDAIQDAVAQRLEPLITHEMAGLSDNDRQAAMAAVIDTFTSADLSDEALFAADADPVKLARQLRAGMPTVSSRSWLGEAGNALYDRLLDECCRVYVQLTVHLPSFAPRGVAELLDRSSSLSAQVEQLLVRLPARTLDAPAGTDHDEEFLQRYLTHISQTLDEVELFGVDVRNYRPRTTLSVAYISLSVSTTAVVARGRRFSGWDRGGMRFDERPRESAGLRVEQALSGAPRMLLRGEAGSGKSTLLRWLAVTAARGAFTADLADWNGRVPFLVKLRSYTGGKLPRPEGFLDGTAGAIAGQMPKGWVHRILASGRALLMIDGVDELPAGERRAIRDWLRGLARAYKEVRVVVTTRPGAAKAKWLKAEGFESATLDRMGPVDVRELVAHWHAAVRDAGDLPCEDHELPRYERELLSRLDTSPHLQGLATNPLLCAMLCALNLDRRTVLPPDRMGVYAAALELLLERRDAERGIPSSVGLQLDTRGKLLLLQSLAWWLSLNGRAELSREEAEVRLSQRLAAMPAVSVQAVAVLDHLLARSGVIREPVDGRIDFVHRTFQEYLTARDAAEEGNVGFLVGRAHLDTWRETVIMAAGHANKPDREALLTGILDRADSERRPSRRLRLLAAACLETVGTLKPDLRARAESSLAELVPPRRPDEARSLASAGDPLLRTVPRDLNELSKAAASATVRAVALVGGTDALNLLSGYAADERAEVRRRVLTMSRYFDAREYGTRVLVQLKPFLEDTAIVDRSQLAAVRHTPGLQRIWALNLSSTRNLADDLTGIPATSRLFLFNNPQDLWPLTKFSETLEEIYLVPNLPIEDLTPLTHLRSLTSLSYIPDAGIQNLDSLRSLPQLTSLGLGRLDGIYDLTPLIALQKLGTLGLQKVTPSLSLDALRHLPRLTHLELGNPPNTGKLRDLLALLPNLESLSLFQCEELESLDPLRGLPNLKTVRLRASAAIDLSPLADLPSLSRLYISASADHPDLSPLADSNLTIHLAMRHVRAHWRKRLKGSVRIRGW